MKIQKGNIVVVFIVVLLVAMCGAFLFHNQSLQLHSKAQDSINSYLINEQAKKSALRKLNDSLKISAAEAKLAQLRSFNDSLEVKIASERHRFNSLPKVKFNNDIQRQKYADSLAATIK